MPFHFSDAALAVWDTPSLKGYLENKAFITEGFRSYAWQRLRTDLLNKRLLAMLLETSKWVAKSSVIDTLRHRVIATSLEKS